LVAADRSISCYKGEWREVTNDIRQQKKEVSHSLNYAVRRSLSLDSGAN
jgi:hypothetical protein